MSKVLKKITTDGSKFGGSAQQTSLTSSYTGPTGATGPAGQDATEPNWTFGTPTVESSAPSVSVTGTYPNQTITFGLVAGNDGATGAQGETGEKGDQGDAGTPAATPNWTFATPTVETSSPSVSVTGTYPNQTITLGLVNGSDGTDGNDGETGSPGADGDGFTGGSYNSSDGIVTFTSNDGIGFSTGDLRGADGTDGDGFTGGSYNSGTGIVTFTSNDGLGFSTGDLRASDGTDGDGFTGGSYNSSTGIVTFTSNDGLGFSTGDLRGADGADGTQPTAQTYVITVSGGKFYVDGTQQDTLHIFRNQKYIIDVSDSSTNSHPFYIQTTDNSGDYDSSNVYTSGVTNSGATTGSITFIPPSDAPSTLYYRCGSHSGMGGSISVKNLNPNDLQGTNGTNGTDGNGFTGGSYNSSTGIVTFTSDDGLGFSTGDVRGTDGNGFTGGSYDSSTGIVTFTSGDGLGFTTGDLRGADGADSTVAGPSGDGFTGGSYNSSTGIVTFTSDDGLGFSTGDLRGTDGTNGLGVPSGGTTNQVLAKASNTDNDTAWVDNTGGVSADGTPADNQIAIWTGSSSVEGQSTLTKPTASTLELNSNGNAFLNLGSASSSSTTGGRLQLYHYNGSDSKITNSAFSGATSNLVLASDDKIILESYTGQETYIEANKGGAVKLLYDDALKLETASGGVSVTGDITVSGNVDGRDLAADGTKLDLFSTPAGATNGYVLTTNGTSASWAASSGGTVPSGGSTSQVLAKASNTDGDATWVDSTGGHTIKDEGSALTARANMTFIGELVAATDNSSTTSTDITIDAKTAWLYG